MIATVIYILTTLFFGYTVYRYRQCNEKTKVTNCFDEGAESFIGIMKSEDYDYH